jgi:hypothetical protein
VKNMEKAKANSGTITNVGGKNEDNYTQQAGTLRKITPRPAEDKAEINTKVYTGAASPMAGKNMGLSKRGLFIGS